MKLYYVARKPSSTPDADWEYVKGAYGSYEEAKNKIDESLNYWIWAVVSQTIEIKEEK